MKIVKYDDIKLTPSAALEVYIDKYPNTKVKELELELKSGSYLYKIKGHDDQKKYKVYVDPVDGMIIQFQEKISPILDTEIRKENADKIQELIDQALNETGEESALHSWSLEIDDGKLELAVKLRTASGEKIEYKYDVNTGQVKKKK